MPTLGIRHLGLKCLAIALATVLWFVVAGEQVVERAMRIPLEYTNLPQQLEMTGDPPTVVDVRVRGSSTALSRIASGELVAVLDLRTARKGQRLMHLGPADVRAPFGVEVVQLNPSNVAMRFEESGSKIVPVVPSIEGDPAEGFVVGTVTADPATVEVIGPVSALKLLTEAVTEPVPVTGSSATVLESVNVGSPDPAVRLRSPQSTKVTVQIRPAPAETVLSVAIRARHVKSAQAAVSRPTHVRVSVRGPHEVVSELQASAFDASVDVEGLAAGRHRVPVQVTAPAHVTVVNVEPVLVQVQVR